MEKHLYAVCVNPHFVRDAQLFNTQNMSDEEVQQADTSDRSYEPDWNDFGEPAPFVAVVAAENAEEACKKAAEDYNHDHRVLFAEEMLRGIILRRPQMPHDKEMEQEVRR